MHVGRYTTHDQSKKYEPNVKNRKKNNVNFLHTPIDKFSPFQDESGEITFTFFPPREKSFAVYRRII